MLERTRVGLLSLWPNRSVTDIIGEGPGPGWEQHCSEASIHDNMLSASVPWQVVLANAGDRLSREDVCSTAEVCKDAFYQVRHNAQSKLAVNLSEAYNLQLVKADTTLVARYPHVSDLCLCMDTDVLEDQDEVLDAPTLHSAALVCLRTLPCMSGGCMVTRPLAHFLEAPQSERKCSLRVAVDNYQSSNCE